MMPVTFSPIITDLGQGVFVPLATGIEFTFTHVAVGTGTSAVNSTATALENEIARFPIAGGGINTGGKSASINALITNHTNANPQNYNISEIGFFGLDASSNTILFAIYRQGATIINKVAGVDIAIPFALGLGALPTSNITVQLDTNISAMMALLGQHTSLNHPHTQYKRTLNNTERLKLADGVDNDDAVSKGQLETVANDAYQDILDLAAATQVLLDNKAYKNGDNTQRFKVAAAIDNDDAVRFDQLYNAFSNSFSVFHSYNKEQDYTNTLKIKANADVIIFASAAGGGGGGQGGLNGSFSPGTDGGDTTIVISKELLLGSVVSPTNNSVKYTLIRLEGGAHGTGGYRFNGNLGNYQSGASGNDGDYIVPLVNPSSELMGILTIILESNGIPNTSVGDDANNVAVTKFRRYRFNDTIIDNAYLTFQESGRGGDGKYTTAGNLPGNSGHGGHGGKVLLHIKNKSTTDMYLSFRIGSKGLGGAGDHANGDNGTDGSILIIGAIQA